MNENLSAQAQRPKFSVAISTPGYQKLINNTLKDSKRAQRFVASITSAVAVNPALQECDPATILSGALLGESLNLSPSPQLGQYYLVPFDNKKKGCKDAQFLLGYKGLVQLALRSGYYKRLNVMAVKAGELVRFDPLTEEIELNIIMDETEREAAATIGYVAAFEYLNGFSKTIFWSREKMVNHADRYSPAFSKNATGGKYPKVSFDDYCAGNYPSSDAWKYSSFWYKDFDGMAYKTMLRQLISKWGVMSTELQTAFESDSEMEQNTDYVQAEEIQPPPQQETPMLEEPAPVESEAQVSLSDV
jgi:recombination protein RecT